MFATRRPRRAMLVTAIGLSALLSAPVEAQRQPGSLEDNGGINGSMSRADLEKLNGNHNQDSSAAVSHTTAAARAKAKLQAAKLVAALQLSCDISDAQLVVAGTQQPESGGPPVDARVYEVACSGKMGYLLEVQGTAKPVGISCLKAEEARAADVAKGAPPGFFCGLAENKDVYATVTSLIAKGAGAPCSVQRLQYFGRNESTHSEYSEVACTEGGGFLLRSPLAGSEADNTVMSCADAAKEGLKCRLTEVASADAPVTLETLKVALGRNGVSCRIEQVRLIGQEDHLKRYVVEYRCAEESGGGIAFIPLQGNSNPYESLDCSAASLQGLACVLTSAKSPMTTQ
jgi:hypothetical protein